MPKPLDILELLLPIPDESVDRALAASIPTASPQDVPRIVEALLTRGRAGGQTGDKHTQNTGGGGTSSEGLVSLILQFHTLPEPVQARIIAVATDLFHALREAISRPSSRGAANSIQIITQARAAKLAYLLSDQLTHGAPEVRPAAAKGLLELAEHAPTNQPEVMAAILTAVREGVMSFKSHGQTTVLLALAALAPRDMAAAVSVIEDRNHPTLEPMKRLLTVELPPEVRRGLIAWSTVRHLSPAAVSGIEKSCDAGHLNDVLAGAHLLTHGQAVVALRKIVDPERALPSPQTLAAMSNDRRRWLPAWINALPFDSARKMDRLGNLHDSPDPATRLAAVRQMIASAWEGTRGTEEVIALFSADPEPAIARIALRHLVARRWPGLTKLLLQLVNSPHEDLRRLAGAHLAPLGFARLWDGWPRLNYAQQLAGGAALIKLDPGFHRLLGEKLLAPQRASRLRAIAIIQTLNQGEFFSDALVALADDGDEVVASAAVKALGFIDKPEVIEALNKALHHGDARVRANAVESLHQLGRQHHEDRLAEMAKDEVNRPRANAIGALMNMRTTEALSSLAKMLADPRPAQRASALWLVDQMGLIEVARHVADLAVADPDYEIKTRAAGVIQRLIDSLRTQGKPGDAPTSTQSKAG